MSKYQFSRGAVLATAAAAIFSAGCTSQNQAEQEGKAAAGQPQAAQPGQAPMQQQGQEAMQGMEGKAKGMMEGMKQQMQGAVDQATEVKVACFGINDCKGQSECATPNNACKGMNACKGKGFLYVSMKECEAKGGKVITPSM
ncbi:hypothetical protein MIT9_P2493 [Methylomarinovum caldicuralii]|uniref:Lipoprotein n=1 Tax=Methylomarinovum caldicuralii TaxID=438856 RepID=A0AAU9CTT9_9GAMM|nr:hypothetical protein [Methylomarinovum caldicuralii]BCX82902.1 hypothetical protein MIT9_P2493 [Methylomarinovum caldicuralii]